MTHPNKILKYVAALAMAAILLYTGYWMTLGKTRDDAEYRQLAQTLTNKQDWTELEKLALDWLRDHPQSAMAHVANGDVLRMRGVMKEAAAAYARALAIDPSNPQVWTYHGVMMLELGSFQSAAESCQKSIDLTDKLAEAFYCLALARAELLDKDGAAKALAQLQQRNPPLHAAALNIIRTHTCRNRPTLGAPLCA